MSAVIERPRFSTVAVACSLPAVVVLVGVAGLDGGSWLNRILPYRNGGNWLFGLLLCCMVLLRFHRRIRGSPPMAPVELRAFTREVSRSVYLVLYSVVGTMLLVRLGQPGFEPPEGLQACLAYALVALILVRALAAVCRAQPRTQP